MPILNALAGFTAYAGGGGSAGGDQTQTLPDSLVAGVGLYITGGGHNLINPPRDSTLALRINRSVPGQLTLTLSTGGLQIRAANTNETCIAEYTVLVYPDSNAANADLNHDGFGTVPNGIGKIVLQGGAGIESGYFARGFFTSSDWVLQPQPGSKFTLRPNGTLTKIISVPNANTAAILTVGDPRTVDRLQTGPDTPALPPFGLALLALALVGSGLWVMRSRRRAPAV